MAKESCINHPKSLPFIVIKQSYVNLFGGDHACAALVYCFEYFTNLQLERLALEGRKDEPWFCAPLHAILSQTTGLYSERSLRPRIDALIRIGILRSKTTRRNCPTRYLLEYKLLNELIQRGEVIDLDSERQFFRPERGLEPQNARKSTEILPVENGAYNKVFLEQEAEDKKEKEKDNYTSLPSSSLDCSDFLRVWKTVRGLPSLNMTERCSAAELWKGFDGTEDQLSAALVEFAGYFRSRKVSGEAIQHPVSYFLKNPSSWLQRSAGEAETPMDDNEEPPCVLKISNRAQMRKSGNVSINGAGICLDGGTVDAKLEEYLEIFIAAQKGIGESERTEVKPEWDRLTDEQKQASIDDAFFRLKLEWDNPRYVPKPAKHLKKYKPWTIKRSSAPNRLDDKHDRLSSLEGLPEVFY